MPNASKDAIYLMEWMLMWDPKKRPTATQVSQHKFFKNFQIYETTPAQSSSKADSLPFDNLKLEGGKVKVTRASLFGNSEIKPIS